MHSDPNLDLLARSQRRTRTTIAAGGALMALALMWTLWPAGTSETATSQAPSSPAEARSPSGTSGTPDLDLAAFNAPLWVNPPQPVVAKAEPSSAPPPPWKAQLLAITRDAEGSLQAVFYDETKDTLVTVAEGGTVVGRIVQRIDERGVTMEPNAQRIELRRDPPRAALRASAVEDLAALLGRSMPRVKPTKEGTP